MRGRVALVTGGSGGIGAALSARPARVPVGRLGRPDEVAGLMLAILRNGYVTNQVISIDGGMYPG